MDIVQVSAETAPWSKTGGLGDVAGALPLALARRGHRVMAVSPRYKPVPEAADAGIAVRVHLFGHDHEVRFHVLEKGDVTFVFVDNPCYRRSGIYGDATGAWSDNLFRYALLTRAGIEAALRIPVKGALLGDDVVFHANDWHTALLPVYLKAIYQPAGRFMRAGTVLGLHNCGHHGTAPADAFDGLDLARRWWPVLDMHGHTNPLKAGIVSADRLVTVSPTYAREIQRTHGFGLEALLAARDRDLWGILNGIDDAWDPKTDRHLPAHFDADDLSGKAANKAALQRDLGLPERADVPMFGLIARLDHQKGIDLVAEIAPWLLQHDVQLVMLGSGSDRWQRFFRETEHGWRDKARGWVGFNEAMAHRIEAAADIFLMPSRFEPCGLNQMYSLRYGTVPIVHATGGLADTVQTYDPSTESGVGWAFSPFDAAAFQQALFWAMFTWWRFPQAWKALQRRGMAVDFSWDRSAQLYERLYTSAKSG